MLKRSSSTSSSEALRRLALFLLLLFLLLVAGNLALRALHPYEQQSWRVQDDMVAELFSAPRDSVDLLLCGTSHMMCGVIPSDVEKATGLSVFNMAASSQLPDTTYHLLREAIRRQHPRYVVMDLYHLFLAREHDAAQSSLILKPMPFCGEKLSMFFDLYTAKEQGELLKTWFNPFYRFKNLAVYRTLVRTGRTEEARDTSGTYEGRGFYSLGERRVDVAKMCADYAEAPELYSGLSETQCDYVRRIATLCREENVSLLFVSVPMSPSYRALFSAYNDAAADVSALCASLSVPYLDFNDPAEFAVTGLADTEYADYAHLNAAGAARFSPVFAERLAELGFLARK